jgi:hypothetical protein
MQKGRGFYTPALLAFVGLVLRLGLVHSYPAAVAAWLTCWSLDVVFVGLTVILEPTSSYHYSSSENLYVRVVSISGVYLASVQGGYIMMHLLRSRHRASTRINNYGLDQGRGAYPTLNTPASLLPLEGLEDDPERAAESVDG